MSIFWNPHTHNVHCTSSCMFELWYMYMYLHGSFRCIPHNRPQLVISCTCMPLISGDFSQLWWICTLKWLWSRAVKCMYSTCSGGCYTCKQSKNRVNIAITIISPRFLALYCMCTGGCMWEHFFRHSILASCITFYMYRIAFSYLRQRFPANKNNPTAGSSVVKVRLVFTSCFWCLGFILTIWSTNYQSDFDNFVFSDGVLYRLAIVCFVIMGELITNEKKSFLTDRSCVSYIAVQLNITQYN